MSRSANYLNCGKFVTSRESVPRLRARWRREQELAAGAVARGWERERERHACAGDAHYNGQEIRARAPCHGSSPIVHSEVRPAIYPAGRAGDSTQRKPT